VGALGFVSADRPFCGHDLEKLQDAGVAESLFLAEGVVNFADRGRAACPEDAQDFELGSGGFLWFLLHWRDHTTKVFVVSTKIFVDRGELKLNSIQSSLLEKAPGRR
jgi:hypothetical protein